MPSDNHVLVLRLPSFGTVRMDCRSQVPLILGSSLDCDIPIRARLVSRRHLELWREDGEIRFRDLGSTNGTFLNEERVSEGVLSAGAFLRVGEAVVALADTATEHDGKLVAPEGLRLTTVAEVGRGHRLPSPPDGDDHRHYGIEELARLVGTFLAEGQAGQAWAMLCRFLREALSCEAVRCYAWEGERLMLRAQDGPFPEDRLCAEQVEQLASLPKMAAAELDDEEGRLVTFVLPVESGGSRASFVGVTRSPGDPLLLHQEVMPVLYVLCRLVVRWAEDLRRGEARVGELAEQVRRVEAGLLASEDAAEPIVGRAPVLLKEIESANRVAPTGVPVLLVGPTGTGKELFARRIHRLSHCSSGPFIPINCASIPENLLESELFGVERGAYTGADRSRAGLFQAAHGGTLFLDEIGDLPIGLQPKLLRVLEEKQVVPLGGSRPRSIVVRLIAATNQDPAKLIQTGRFRKDLYYRLAGMVLNLPALHDRDEDVLELANYFLQVANREFGKRVRGFEVGAVRELQAVAWPGNVRQLQAIIKQVVLTAEGRIITAEALHEALSRHDSGDGAREAHWALPWAEANEAFEDEYFRRRLVKYRGSLSALAKELGITRPNLYLKMKKLGIQPGQDLE